MHTLLITVFLLFFVVMSLLQLRVLSLRVKERELRNDFQSFGAPAVNSYLPKGFLPPPSGPSGCMNYIAFGSIRCNPPPPSKP